jgi:Divergent InlB B-repeat domain
MRGLTIVVCLLFVACGDVVKTGNDAETGGSGSFAPHIPIDPASCGNDCIALPRDAVVSLVATPAEGSTFAGWSGDCAGLDDCTIVMDRGHQVSATFVRNGDTAPAREVVLPETDADVLPLVVTTRGDGLGRVTWR